MPGRPPAPPAPPLSPDDEAERILGVYGHDALPEIMPMLERQFAVLHNRAQVLLVLVGVVISTTGFSGRLIAGTNAYSQWLIVAGVGLCLLAAVVVVSGVLHLRWLTTQGGATTAEWLRTTLAYRDRKTRFYRAGIVLLLVGLTCYFGAIAITLLNPEEDRLPARERVAAPPATLPTR